MTIALEDDLNITKVERAEAISQESDLNNFAKQESVSGNKEKDNPLKTLANSIYQNSLKQKKKSEELKKESVENNTALSFGDVEFLKNELTQLKDFVYKIAENSYKETISLKNENIKKIYKIMNLADIDESFTLKLLMKIEEKFSNRLSDYNYLLELVKKSLTMKLDTDSTFFDSSKRLFFVGPTGVGKTTTIAKLSSIMRLIEEKEVGIISLDTFRIAAVEQLKTFASISSIPFLASYNRENFMDSINRFDKFEKIFIDTAGRSPKNIEHVNEMIKFIGDVEDKCVILLLSATTKLKDMLLIYEKFSQVKIDGVIFTKTDEASTLGDVFNFLQIVKKPLLFITNGQNVPDDIVKIDSKEFVDMIFSVEE